MFYDDNKIFRCQSRFDNADFTYDEKYPITYVMAIIPEARWYHRRGVPLDSLITYWQSTQRVLDAAWKTYRDIYLKGLRLYFRNNKEYQIMNVGDRTLLVDEQQPAALWRTGVVVKQIPDARGVIRTYEIESGNRKYVRPAQKLAPLERGGMDIKNDNRHSRD